MIQGLPSSQSPRPVDAETGCRRVQPSRSRSGAGEIVAQQQYQLSCDPGRVEFSSRSVKKFTRQCRSYCILLVRAFGCPLGCRQ